MSSTGLSCIILADGSYVDANKVIGSGLDGYIIHNTPSTVLKVPKLTGMLLSDGAIKPNDDNIYASDLNNEKEIYRRLQGVQGVAKCLSMSTNGLLLEYYGNGSLEDYLECNPPSTWSQRLDWILQIVDIFTACHDRKVLPFDIALRNLLLADDRTIRAIDFAQGTLLPINDATILVGSDGYTAKVDILHVTNVIYSLCCWKRFQTDCVWMDEWPSKESFPSTSGLRLGGVISASWSRQIEDLKELKHAILSAVSSSAPSHPEATQHWSQ